MNAPVRPEAKATGTRRSELRVAYDEFGFDVASC